MTALVILRGRPARHEATLLAGVTGFPLASTVPEGGVGLGFGPNGLEMLMHRDKPGHGARVDAEWIRRELALGGNALRGDPLVRAVGGAAVEEGAEAGTLASDLDGGPVAAESSATTSESSRQRHAKRPLVVDATAGFCGDALLLAAVGYRVVAFERHPAISAVTTFNIGSLRSDAALGAVASAVEIRGSDARRELPRLAERPEVVLLDPMFPPKRRRSALPPKPIQLLRLLAGDDSDAAELLAVARACATKRVVVKRSDDAPPLGDLWPDWSVPGKTVRYDVYATHGRGDARSASDHPPGAERR